MRSVMTNDEYPSNPECETVAAMNISKFTTSRDHDHVRAKIEINHDTFEGE